MRRFYDATVRGIAEVIEAGAMRPGLPPEQVTDLLFAMRLGIVAAHLGKQRRLPSPNRIAISVAVLQSAWEPTNDGDRHD